MQRGRKEGLATRNNKLDFGDFGLQALESAHVSGQQLEAVRVAVNRHLHRKGKVWLRLFPDKPITKKPLEVRMGKGKGNPEGWVAVVKPGNMIVEISGCSERLAKEALARAASKLPCRCKLLVRYGVAS